jgi:response regulator RpfG family c-di-GMP phosphodiesterase
VASIRNRVLILDDDPRVGSGIAEELSARGFVCRVADDVQKALEFLDAEGADVLIAEACLPGGGGLDLVAYARRRSIPCRAIVTAGQSSREHLSRALMLGVYDYLEKPFQTSEIVDMVRRAVSAEARDPVLPDRAAAAMELCSQGKHASLDSVAALVRAVEAKDPYTRRHSEHVAQYACGIGGAMGLSGPGLESLRIASLLHDIGKIGVPDRVLTKAGPLSEEEFQQIRGHPALGADILAHVQLFAQEAQIVRCHHERWDGLGYPSGLKGEESPLASRIIQIADCMDAMLMERTYKRAYPVDQMIGELIRCAGMQFDPRLAAVAVQWCRSKPDKLILPSRELVEAI